MAGKIAFALMAVMALGACGGSVGVSGGTGTTSGPAADPPLQPVQVSLFSPSPRWTITDGGTSGSVIATRISDGQEFPLSMASLAVNVANFEAYSNAAPINAVLGVTPSGEGRSFVIWNFQARQSDAVHERLSETTVPASGSASFNGSYMALWWNTADVTLAAHLLGSVALSADFDAQRIAGIISSRRNTGSEIFRDVVLEPTDIVDGAFAGSATGGELEGGAQTTSGRYEGLLVGLNSPEAVGTVVIVHGNASPSRAEYGSFVARDPAAPALP